MFLSLNKKKKTRNIYIKLHTTKYVTTKNYPSIKLSISLITQGKAGANPS